MTIAHTAKIVARILRSIERKAKDALGSVWIYEEKELEM
jgi:hypothetical protein